MSNKLYDILKWITLVLLQALTTFMGAILGISNINYKSQRLEQEMEEEDEY